METLIRCRILRCLIELHCLAIILLKWVNHLSTYPTRSFENIPIIRIVIAFTGHLYSSKPVTVVHVSLTFPLKYTIFTLSIWTFYLWACWVKCSSASILKYFSIFPQKTGFDISCKLSPWETICMKCQSLFSCQIKNNQFVVCWVCLKHALITPYHTCLK